MKLLFAFLFCFFNVFCFSQTKDDWNSIATGQWAFDVNPSLFVLSYRLDFFLSNDKSKKLFSSDLLKKENIDLADNSYKKFKYGDKGYLITKASGKKNSRIFKILKEKNDFFILCSEDDVLCDCKSDTFIYNKSQNKLQRIEKPFSFSLKNNLLDRLQEFNIEYSQENEKLSFCQILEDI